jgi:hypothetical protein
MGAILDDSNMTHTLDNDGSFLIHMCSFGWVVRALDHEIRGQQTLLTTATTYWA